MIMLNPCTIYLSLQDIQSCMKYKSKLNTSTNPHAFHIRLDAAHIAHTRMFLEMQRNVFHLFLSMIFFHATGAVRVLPTVSSVETTCNSIKAAYVGVTNFRELHS